jgi:cytochrome c5
MLLILLTFGCDDTVFSNGTGGGGAVVGDSYADAETVFADNCVSCHSAAGAPSFGGLDLATDSCAATVGVVSPDYEAPLVAPGDSAGSVLWNKIADSGMYGNVMPPSGAIAQESVDTIAAWIDAGAACGDTGGAG